MKKKRCKLDHFSEIVAGKKMSNMKKNAIFYDATHSGMHLFEIHSCNLKFSLHENH